MFEQNGGEFLVNTTIARQQSQSDVAELQGGGFVAAWVDSSQTGADTSLTAIRAQVFGADGIKQGAEFVVNTTTQQGQSAPGIAGLADGGFVVTWADRSASGGDNSGGAVRGQVFDADGTARGGEFLVNDIAEGTQGLPDVAALAGGGFVATWDDRSGTAGPDSTSDVRGQVFAADGSRVGDGFRVNEETLNSQDSASVAGLGDGGFVVAWDDSSARAGGGDADGSAVRARVFAADGTSAGGEFLVNETTDGFQFDPSVDTLADGGFAIAWGDTSGSGGDASGDAVRARVFAADGTPRGSETLVNTVTEGGQSDAAVVGLDGGGFVVTWGDESRIGTDTSLGAVKGRSFDAGGAAEGAEFLVNSSTTNIQSLPSVAALDGGGFVATFTDGSRAGLDTDSSAVKGQIFAPADGGDNTGATIDLLGLTPEQQVSAVYVAYFGRAPSPAGLDFWVGQRAAGLEAGDGPGAVLDDIAESFRNVVSFAADAPENTEGVSFDLFRNPAEANQTSVARFVNEVFDNLFNRTAEGTADDPTTGLGFWTETIQDRLAAGVNIGDIMVDIASGARGADAVTVANKIDAGVAFAEAFRATDGAAFDVAADRDLAVETIRAVNDTGLAVAQARAAAQRFAQQDAAETQAALVGVASDADPAAIDGLA